MLGIVHILLLTRTKWGSEVPEQKVTLNYTLLQHDNPHLRDSINPFEGNIYSVQFSHSVMSDSLRPHGLQHTTSLSITSSQSLLKVMSVESVMPSNHRILCRPLLFLPSIFPSIRVFSSEFFASGGQSIGVSASASVLPINIQDWFPLGWTGLISLQSKGLSRVFSNTTVQKHQFFGSQLSLYSSSHIRTWLLEKP